MGWPSPPDELTQLNLPGMVGQLVCSFNVYYGSADGLAQGITTNWARPHVLPGLNMTPAIVSTGPGLILVPSFLSNLLFFEFKSIGVKPHVRPYNSVDYLGCSAP